MTISFPWHICCLGRGCPTNPGIDRSLVSCVICDLLVRKWGAGTRKGLRSHKIWGPQGQLVMFARD